MFINGYSYFPKTAFYSEHTARTHFIKFARG
jgi:hypothetical protein